MQHAEIIAMLATLVEGRPWNYTRIYRVYCRATHYLRRWVKRRLPKRLRVPLYVPRLSDTVCSLTV